MWELSSWPCPPPWPAQERVCTCTACTYCVLRSMLHSSIVVCVCTRVLHTLVIEQPTVPRGDRLNADIAVKEVTEQIEAKTLA